MHQFLEAFGCPPVVSDKPTLGPILVLFWCIRQPNVSDKLILGSETGVVLVVFTAFRLMPVPVSSVTFPRQFGVCLVDVLPLGSPPTKP